MNRSVTDMVIDEWNLELPPLSTVIDANQAAREGGGSGGGRKRKFRDGFDLLPPSPPPKYRLAAEAAAAAEEAAAFVAAASASASTSSQRQPPSSTYTSSSASSSSSFSSSSSSSSSHRGSQQQQVGKDEKPTAAHQSGKPAPPLALAADVIRLYHEEKESNQSSARQRVQHQISQLIKQCEIRSGSGREADAAVSSAESVKLVDFINALDEPPPDLGGIFGGKDNDEFALPTGWGAPPSTLPYTTTTTTTTTATTTKTTDVRVSSISTASSKEEVATTQAEEPAAAADHDEAAADDAPFDIEKVDPEGLFEAMHGDGEAAVALRAVMTNDFVGVSGLSNVKKAQSLNGTVIHDPRPSQMPKLRPALRSCDVFKGVTEAQYVRVGIKEVHHRKVFTGAYDKFRKPHQLYLFGVLPDGQSIDIEVRGFNPSFCIVADHKWSNSEIANLHEDLNLTLEQIDPQAKNKQKGGAKFKGNGGKGKGTTTTQSFRPPPVVHSIVRVEATPTIGFSTMRRDHLLRVTVSNACHTEAAVHELRDLRGMRIVHDEWHLDQQFIHAMQKQSPSSLSHTDPKAWDKIDKKKALKLNRWVKIRKRDLEMVMRDADRQTTGQLQGSVYWKHLQPEPDCDDALPILVAQIDGEMISQHQFETGVDSFPQAANKRDKCISLSALLSVNGYSHRGPFLRTVFAVGSSKPIPGCIVYTFSTEALMLVAFRLWLIEHCDIGAVGGYNTKDFDMPYLFKRSEIAKCPEFRRWNRFSRDSCRMPNDDFQSVQMVGRWQLDLMKIVMTRWKSVFSSFSLRNVAAKLIPSGVNKIDMPYRDIAHHFHAPQDEPDGRTKVNFYCINDAALCEVMNRGSSMMEAYLAICKLTNTPFENVMQGGQQIRVYNMCIERIHHYRWYENKYLMDESQCYREPVPLDWNGYTEGHHLHELLSKARDAGYIEPDDGFVYGDPRSRGRDKVWKKVLVKSFVLEKKNDPKWAGYTDEHKKHVCDTFVHGLMYESDAKRTNKNHKKRKAELMNQPILEFGPTAAAPSLHEDVLSDRDIGGISGGVGDGSSFADGECEDDLNDDTPPQVQQPAAKKRATLDGVVVNLGNNSSSGSDESPTSGAGSPLQTIASSVDVNAGCKRRKTINGSFIDVGTAVEDARRLEEILYRDSPVAQPGHKRKFYPGDKPLGAAPRTKAEAKGLSGGCVFRSLRGVWERLFSILDFASLYPSIIQAQMVDYATLVWEEKYMNLPGYKYRRVAYMGYFYYWVVADPARLSSTQHEKAVKEGRPIAAAVTQSILPEILSELVFARRAVKGIMKYEEDPFKKATLDNEQAALKIVCNAAYGFLKVNAKRKGTGSGGGGDDDDDADEVDDSQILDEPAQKRRKMDADGGKGKIKKWCKGGGGAAASKKNGKGGKLNAAAATPAARKQKAYLSCPPLSYIVTSTGRDMIRLVKYFAEIEQGCETIYGDTDSVMVTASYLDAIRNSGAPDAERQYEKAFERLCGRVVERANDFFLYPNELENENTCKRGYFDKKKMYAYMAHLFKKDAKGKTVYDEDGDRIMLEKTKLTVKGMIKRDRCKAVRDLVGTIVREHLVYNNIEPVKALVSDFVEKLGKNQVPLNDLSISAAFNPATERNAAVKPYTFVKESRRRGVTYSEGDRMQYVMRAEKFKDEKDYMRGEELEYAKETKITVDAEFYFSKQLQNPISTLVQFHMDPDQLFADLHEMMNTHIRNRDTPDSAKETFTGGTASSSFTAAAAAAGCVGGVE